MLQLAILYSNHIKMRAFIALVCISSVISLSSAQFVNGRFLEPPVPALCAKQQRPIHERAPDGKGYVKQKRNSNTERKLTLNCVP